MKLMGKTKTNITGQLQLNLVFTDPHPSVLRKLALLVEVADESDVTGEPELRHEAKGSDPEKPVRAGKQADPDRRAIHKLVGCVAIATGASWHDVWVKAYHRFFRRTGHHPVTESVRLKLATHLDFVCGNSQWMDVLKDELEKMLLEA